MSVLEALDISIQVASALEAAHTAGGIKLEDTMLRPDGYVKILDFGLAELTARRASLDRLV